MTKKQIEAVVQALRRVRTEAHGNYDESIGVIRAASAIAGALEKTRKGFDRERFLRDCGVPS